MRVKLALFLIILLIAIPHISAVDTSDWIELTVNNVDFKIPDKYFNESKGKNHIVIVINLPLFPVWIIIL